MTGVDPVINDLASRVQSRLQRNGRLVIGIVGVPGAGKSTLASKVAARLNSHGTPTVVVPMDGFHLADRVLRSHGNLRRKGAIETFDGWGYVATLKRIRDDLTDPIYAPGFERTFEQPIAGAIEVLPTTKVVLTEGNYLLDASEPWAQVKALLDEVWFVEQSHKQRIRNLIGRHIEFGKQPPEARRWVLEVDETNARRVETGRDRADLIIRIDDEVSSGDPTSKKGNL